MKAREREHTMARFYGIEYVLAGRAIDIINSTGNRNLGVYGYNMRHDTRMYLAKIRRKLALNWNGRNDNWRPNES